MREKRLYMASEAQTSGYGGEKKYVRRGAVGFTPTFKERQAKKSLLIGAPLTRVRTPSLFGTECRMVQAERKYSCHTSAW